MAVGALSNMLAARVMHVSAFISVLVSKLIT